MPRVKALVTGFAPFAGDAINPSFEAVRHLPARIGRLEVITAELPTSFAQAPKRLKALMKAEQPDIVLCVGLAADRGAVNIERVAINLCDARIADNDGAQPRNRAIVAGGPSAYFSTLPVTRILQALERAGVAAELSLSAGAFVCNQVFYQLMHAEARRGQGHDIKCAGFIHVPALPKGKAEQEVKLNELVRALTIALEVTSGGGRRRSVLASKGRRN